MVNYFIYGVFGYVIIRYVLINFEHIFEYNATVDYINAGIIYPTEYYIEKYLVYITWLLCIILAFHTNNKLPKQPQIPLSLQPQ